MAGVGVGSLALVANQYRKTLATRPIDAGAQAARLVDGFLAARQAVRDVDARYAGRVRGSAEAVQTLRRERRDALAAHGMSYQDYVAVRRAWRAVRSGSAVVDPYFAAAFRARPEALSEAALPAELEHLDDEIK